MPTEPLRLPWLSSKPALAISSIPLLGYLTVAYEENDTRRFSRLMGLTVGGTILVGLACAVLLYFFGDMLYALIYGEEVLSYMYLIPLLIVSSVTMSFATFLNTLMVALRNFKATLVGGLLSLAVSLGTMVPFVWLFQLNGATALVDSRNGRVDACHGPMAS